VPPALELRAHEAVGVDERGHPRAQGLVHELGAPSERRIHGEALA